MGRAGRTVLRAVPVLAGLALLASALPAGASPGFNRRARMPFPVAWTAPNPSLSYADIACPRPSTCTAIGAYLSTSGAILPSADTEVDGAWQAPTAIALPKGATSYLDGLRSISCPSAGNCVAVGTAQSASPLLEPVLAVETDGVWGTATSAMPVPHGTDLAYLWSIWCAGVGSCVAVGSFSTSLQGEVHAFIDVETAGVWRFSTILKDPVSALVTADLDVVPQDLSCADVLDCVVVGYLDGAPATTAQLAFGVAEDRGVWGAPQVFDPSRSDEAFLRSVSCEGGVCMAVGTSYPPQALGALPYAVAYISGRWREPQYLDHRALYNATYSGLLDSVACPTPQTCVAVGALGGNHYGPTSASDEGLLPVAYTWSEGVWTRPSQLQQRIDSGNEVDGGATFNAVSCATPAACVATGTSLPGYTTSNEQFPFSVELAPVAPRKFPSQPVDLDVRVGHGRLGVYWRAPHVDGGSAIVAYEVTARSPGEPTVRRATPGRSCGLDHLVAGRRYVVQVVARNAAGRSGPAARTAVEVR